MILAEVTVGLDTLAGGGVTGMLVVVMTAFLRRTKDTDERRDAASKMIMDAAMERESRAWAERDRALLERDQAREELSRFRAEVDADRRGFPRKWKDIPAESGDDP